MSVPLYSFWAERRRTSPREATKAFRKSTFGEKGQLTNHQTIFAPAADVNNPNPLMKRSFRLRGSNLGEHREEERRRKRGDGLVFPQDADLRVLVPERVAPTKQGEFGHCLAHTRRESAFGGRREGKGGRGMHRMRYRRRPEQEYAASCPLLRGRGLGSRRPAYARAVSGGFARVWAGKGGVDARRESLRRRPSRPSRRCRLHDHPHLGISGRIKKTGRTAIRRAPIVSNLLPPLGYFLKSTRLALR